MMQFPSRLPFQPEHLIQTVWDSRLQLVGQPLVRTAHRTLPRIAPMESKSQKAGVRLQIQCGKAHVFHEAPQGPLVKVEILNGVFELIQYHTGHRPAARNQPEHVFTRYASKSRSGMYRSPHSA